MNKNKILLLLATSTLLTLSACGGESQSQDGSISGAVLYSSDVYEICSQAMENRYELASYQGSASYSMSTPSTGEYEKGALSVQTSFYKGNVISAEMEESYIKRSEDGVLSDTGYQQKSLLWAGEPLDETILDQKQVYLSQEFISYADNEKNYSLVTLLDDASVDKDFKELYLNSFKSSFQPLTASFVANGEFSYYKVNNKKVVGEKSELWSVGSNSNPKYPSDSSKNLGVWMDYDSQIIYEKDANLGWVCTYYANSQKFGLLTDNDFQPLEEMEVLQDETTELSFTYSLASKLPAYKGEKVFDDTPSEDLSALSPILSRSTDGQALEVMLDTAFTNDTATYNLIHGTKEYAVFSTSSNTVNFAEGYYYGVTTNKLYTDKGTLSMVSYDDVSISQEAFKGLISENDAASPAPTFFKVNKTFSAYVTLIYHTQTDIEVVLNIVIDK